ncbi:hypothetical protein [Nonomuraea bangladeshensis]|uniref:hypothetical protein n=1 Tax=Nonomuraea bangladeshensis TaxID=404385 RepID=UPI003C2F6349
MTDLPPFSGDSPTCPKCGNVGAYTKHRSGRDPFASHPGEHLERSCTRCGYEWAEATVDQQPIAASRQSGEAAR